MERAAVLMLLAGLGCEAPASAPPSTPDPLAHEIEEALEQLPPPPASAWPTEVVSLREAISGFTDVGDCLASLRERTPTEVAEGVSDLGYDAFFDDICGSMRAIRSGSVEGCDALSVSSARRGCRRRLALFHGDPGACPTDRVRPGREPVCVAWALRDEDLCQAAAAVERARCRAVLGADPSRCSRARGGDRVRCQAEVDRYASALGEERRESPAATGERELRLELDGATLLRETAARGVRLVNVGCRTTIELTGPISELRLGRQEGAFSLSLVVHPRIELPAELALGAHDALLEVRTLRRGHLSSASGARGHVSLTTFERRRGGALAGTIEGSLSLAGEEVVVRGRFATFIRDVDPLDDACRDR